jgi:hypothetical protein
VVTSLTKVTVGVGVQLSDVVTLPGLGAGTVLAQVTVTFEGQVIDGGDVSTTESI